MDISKSFNMLTKQIFHNCVKNEQKLVIISYTLFVMSSEINQTWQKAVDQFENEQIDTKIFACNKMKIKKEYRINGFPMFLSV